ncbi:MAG: hypothetical protein ABEJ31_00515 [Haloarculaceae archaeon]
MGTQESSSRPRSHLEASARDHSDAFDVLTDEHRCRAIEYLDRAGPTAVDDLVGYVVSRSDHEGTELDARSRMRVRFHHVHLPKMVDAGLVEYDREDSAVEPTAKLTQAVALLDPVADDGTSTGQPSAGD